MIFTHYVSTGFYWDMDCDCLGGTEGILKIWDDRSASNHDEALQDVTHGVRYIDYLGGEWVGGGGGGVDGVGWAFQKQGPLKFHTKYRKRIRAMMCVRIANPRWLGKRSRHSRRMRKTQFYVSGKRPIMKYHHGCNELRTGIHSRLIAF